MQRRLVRYGIGGRHLTWTTLCGNQRGGLVRLTFGGIAPGLGHHARIDIRARINQQLHRRQNTVRSAIASACDTVAELDAGCGHQRRDTFLARQIDECTVLQQQLDERRVAGTRRAQQRRRTLREDRVAATILRHIAIRGTAFQLKIGIGAGFQQQGHQFIGTGMRDA